MSYAVKVLADSIGPSGKRLTTIELTYQRFVHAELMTHRLLSRNSASSRAIPVAKMLKQIAEDPAMPVWWGKNQSGMEAAEELSDVTWTDTFGAVVPSARAEAQRLWLEARDSALMYAQRLAEVGLHKQIANRVTEPWMWITVIVSATEWSNVWGLRLTKHAQPEIRHAIQLAHDAIAASTPEVLPPGAWHMPLIRPADVTECCALALAGEGIDPASFFDPRSAVDAMLRKLSVARCARVSYLTHDGRRDLVEDFKLHDRLASNGHWSPFEHVARALDDPRRVGNFIGWHQYRKDFQNEQDRDKKASRAREAKLEDALAKALEAVERSEGFADRLIDDVNRLSQEVDALQKRLDSYARPAATLGAAELGEGTVVCTCHSYPHSIWCGSQAEVAQYGASLEHELTAVRTERDALQDALNHHTKIRGT